MFVSCPTLIWKSVLLAGPALLSWQRRSRLLYMWVRKSHWWSKRNFSLLCKQLLLLLKKKTKKKQEAVASHLWCLQVGFHMAGDIWEKKLIFFVDCPIAQDCGNTHFGIALASVPVKWFKRGLRPCMKTDTVTTSYINPTTIYQIATNR